MMSVGNFGNFCTGINPGMSNSNSNNKHCSAQSIMKALDNFLNAMNQMSDVVMVPNRLKDIEVPLPTPTASWEKAVVPFSRSQSSDSKADLFSFYRMLHCVQQELVYGTEESPKRTSSVGSSGRTSGSESPLESDLEEGFDSEIRDARAHQLATNFKIHLRGLFEVMHQLTDTAKYLSDTYQEDVSSARKG